jgi:hypothetical protein
VRTILELDERKPARAPRFAIDGQHHLGRRSHGSEIRAQVGFGRGIRQVADEQTDSQSTLS